MAKTLYVPDEEEYTTAETPLLKSFPRYLDDEPALVTRKAPHSPYYVVGLVLTIVFAADLAGSISKAPLIRVLESIICNEHYKTADPSRIQHNGQVDERYCKIGPVQEELALLRGWQDFFDYLPGLFLAIPFGMLADRYGRKWLSVLNVTSLWLRSLWILFVCTFPQVLPIRMIWLQGVLGVLGGGTLVASALLFVITTDVASESQRANVFFYAHAALCATEFFGPPIGSILMEHSPWIPLLLSITLLTLNIPLALALPETLPKPTPTARRPSIPSSSDRAPNSSRQTPLFTHLKSNLPSLSFLLSDPRILLILTASIAYIFAQATSNLTIQYTSRRYTFSLSQAAYLGSVRAVIMLLALLVGLPFASTYLLRRRAFTPLRKDVLLLRISFTLVGIGLLIEGFAPDIPLFVIGCCVATLGMGATALIRSLLSSLVETDEVGRLFAVMSLVWTGAMLVASPVVARLFGEGLKRGGMWMGLPFVFAGVLFVVATVAMWGVDLGGVQEARGEEDGFAGEGEGGGEKEGLLGVAETPLTPAFRFKVEHSGFAEHGAGRHVPAPLTLEGGEMGGLRTPRYLETPLYSPGLRIMEARGGF